MGDKILCITSSLLACDSAANWHGPVQPMFPERELADTRVFCLGCKVGSFNVGVEQAFRSFQ
ncbi:STYKc [Musa troglodytarum]|nr:STYKc [Musa troglodytarum]